MKKFFLIISAFWIFTTRCNSQSSNAWAQNLSNDTEILTYGLEDKTTTDLIEVLLADSNNIVLLDDFGNGLLERLSDGSVHVMGGESQKCNDYITSLINKLYNSKRLFGLSRYVNTINDYYYFTKVDSLKYDSILKKFAAKDLETYCLDPNSTNKIELVNTLIKEFNLSSADSLFLTSECLQKPFNIEELIKVFPSKHFIFLYSIVTYYDVDKFVKEHSIDFITVAKYGNTRPRQKYFLSFRNHLKTKPQFAEISFEELPKIVYFNLFEKCKKSDIANCRFIYLEHLDNCAYD